MNLNTYLNFGGNCEEAFRFYEKHLGAKVTAIMKHRDSPTPVAGPEWQEKVLHARLEIADTVLLGSDVPADRFQPMRSAYLTLSTGSTPDAERIHKALADGGQVFMQMEETFFAHRFSSLRDRFGVLWNIIHQKPMN